MYARMDAQRVRDLPRLLLVHPDGSPGDGPRCFWSACGRSASPRSDDSEHRACLAGGASPASVGDPVQTDGGDAGTLAWPPWRDVVDRRPLPPPAGRPPLPLVGTAACDTTFSLRLWLYVLDDVEVDTTIITNCGPNQSIPHPRALGTPAGSPPCNPSWSPPATSRSRLRHKGLIWVLEDPRPMVTHRR